MYKLKNFRSIRRFIFSGYAKFTIQNDKTGNKLTYKSIRKPRKDVYWIHVVVGGPSQHVFKFLGTYSEAFGFKWSDKSQLASNSLSVKAIVWFFNYLKRDIEDKPISVYHLGFCGRCGKVLTSDESLENGFGPECIEKVNDIQDHIEEIIRLPVQLNLFEQK